MFAATSGLLHQSDLMKLTKYLAVVRIVGGSNELLNQIRSVLKYLLIAGYRQPLLNMDQGCRIHYFGERSARLAGLERRYIESESYFCSSSLLHNRCFRASA